MNIAVSFIHAVQIRWRLVLAMYVVTCALPTAIFAQTAEQSGQNNTQEWHYTLRPADSLQKVGMNLLSRQYSWTDLVHYNRIEDVASLQPGSIVRIPMHWLKQQPKPATVMSISGSAMIKRITDTHFQVMTPDMSIQVGDEVLTRNGSVLIKFADGSILRLDKNSNLVFNKLSHFGHTGMVDTRMRLKKGMLSTEVMPLVKGSRYEISTPSAVAAVRGTKFRMETNGKNTQIEVTEGFVEFNHAHGSTVVSEGEGARVKQGSAIIEKTRLAPAPEPKFADSTISDLPATLTWKDKQAAKNYRYQLIDKGNGDQRVQTSTLTKPEVTLSHVQNGHYQVAMRSINNNGFEGMDASSDLEVNIASLVPELIAPLDGSILDNPMPKFIWKFKGKDELAKLEIATDPDFESIITAYEFELSSHITPNSKLAPGDYFWRVVALADDSEQSVSSARALSIRGLMAPVKILSVNYINDQVGLFWKNLKQSRGYILQVSDSANFLNILKEETLNKPNAHLKLTPGKRYYARVKGVGDSLYKSNYGPTKELFIKQQQ